MKPAMEWAEEVWNGWNNRKDGGAACVDGGSINILNRLTEALEARDEEWAERERVAFGADPKGGRE